MNRSLLVTAAVIFASSAMARTVDLTNSVVVVRAGKVPLAESTASRMFMEEIEKRTGVHLATSTTRPSGKSAIVIETAAAKGGKVDGYHVFLDSSAPVLSAIGNDARGTLFAAGQLLRR